MPKLSRKAFTDIALAHKFIGRTRQSRTLLSHGEMSNWVQTVLQFGDNDGLLTPHLMSTGNIMLRWGRVNYHELCLNKPWGVKKELYLYNIDGHKVLRLSHMPMDDEPVHNYYMLGGTYNENT
jgi:hypothetical protein